MSGRGRLGPLLLVLALGALLYLPGLGNEILRHPLEAKYALAAREMVRGGPWLVAHLFGEIYPDKPPLYFWATAAIAEMRGGRFDEVTARLPAATGGRRAAFTPRRAAARRASGTRQRGGSRDERPASGTPARDIPTSS